MKIKYVFDGIECDVDTTTPSDFEPKSERKLCDGVEYEFDVVVDFEDFFEFNDSDFNWAHFSSQEKQAYQLGCRNVFHSPWFSLEALEEDEKFIAFMKERYEEEAREECQKENE